MLLANVSLPLAGSPSHAVTPYVSSTAGCTPIGAPAALATLSVAVTFIVVSTVVMVHVAHDPSEAQLVPLTVPTIVSPTDSGVEGQS
jgi:hypothetical protein